MKRTCSAKNRANFDIIESFFQEDPCMDLASRLIWSWQNSMEAVFLSNHKVHFCISVIWQVLSFRFTVKWEKYFSVKSSWEVHWIVMFQKDAVCICSGPYPWTCVCPPRVAVERIPVFDISVLMSWIPSCSRILGRKWVWSSELVSCVHPREYRHRRLTRILLVERLTPLPVNHCGCPSDIYLVEMVPSFVDESWNLHVPGVIVPALGVMVCRWLRIWHQRAAPLVIS